MSKNITEMSFDDIFPATPFPENKKSYSEYSSDSFSDDDAGYDDYGSDISSFGTDIGSSDPPAGYQAQGTGFNGTQNNSQNVYYGSQGNAVSQGVPYGTNVQMSNEEKLRGYVEASPDSHISKLVNVYQGNRKTPANGKNSAKTPDPLILAVISFFVASFFPIGLILSIIACVLVFKNESSSKKARGLCIGALVVNVLVLITRFALRALYL